MIEIIPNWHPLLVHFTLGLLTIAVLFYLFQALLSETSLLKQQWLNMANWSLWTGCIFALATAIAGWFAYNSVAHDELSHAAMTVHRNWAIPTAGIFLLLGLWTIVSSKARTRPSVFFIFFSLIAAGMLMFTGWLGAEAVYRYGLGVQSLPVVEEGSDGHNHSHGEENTEEDSDGHNHRHGEENTEVNTDDSIIDMNDQLHDHIHNTKKTIEQSSIVEPHNHLPTNTYSHNTQPGQKNDLTNKANASPINQHSHDGDVSSHHHH